MLIGSRLRSFATSAGKFLKILNGKLVLALVTGAGRYFDETQRLQLTTDGRFINRDAELFEYPSRQILAAPAHHTVDRRDRTTFDEPGKGLALAIIELGWLARRFAINQAIGAFGVETQNPVSDTLQTNRPDPRRIQTLATIINRGQRKQPPALTRIL